MTELRIATRRSALALAQARQVADAIEASLPGTEITLVEVATTGDRDLHTPVATLTEVGAFVRAIQREVLEGRADLAVHSAKDLPVDGPEELRVYYPEREVVFDVLCGSSLDGLPHGARVGTGSPRRTAQLLALRPDLTVDGIRGNVDTRLRQVDSGEYDAVVLAEAGLRRLGLEASIEHRFGLAEMVPAAGQAALAVEVVAGSRAEAVVVGIEDGPTRRALDVERALLAATRAGCRSALGVYARSNGSDLVVDAFVADERGPRATSVAGSDHELVPTVRRELGL